MVIESLALLNGKSYLGKLVLERYIKVMVAAGLELFESAVLEITVVCCQVP